MSSSWKFLLWLDVLGFLHRAQASRQAALLSVLAIATERKLPLTPMLDAFADDARFGWRHGVRDLADLLQSGTSLPDALEAVPGLLPPDAVLAARLGAESGTLAAALRMAAARLAPASDVTTSSPGSVVIYLMFLTCIMLSILSFIMVFIIPKFAKIFRDLDTELPPLTVFVIEASNFAATYGLLLIPFVFVLLWIAMIYAVAVSRPTIPLTGPFKILARTMPRIATGNILRNLSIAVAAGRPLSGALSTLAGFHPAHAIRRRLAGVADEVEKGRDCWESLREAGLIQRREAALLWSAQRAGNLAWALETLGNRIDDGVSLKFKVLVEFVRPVLVVAYAAVTGAVVVGLFLPIVKLVNDLS